MSDILPPGGTDLSARRESALFNTNVAWALADETITHLETMRTRPLDELTLLMTIRPEPIVASDSETETIEDIILQLKIVSAAAKIASGWGTSMPVKEGKKDELWKSGYKAGADLTDEFAEELLQFLEGITIGAYTSREDIEPNIPGGESFEERFRRLFGYEKDKLYEWLEWPDTKPKER